MAQQPFHTLTGYYKTSGQQFTVYSLFEDYSITFETNGGVSVAPINNVVTIPVLPVTTKTDYFFNGWYYDALLTTQAHAGDVLTGDVVLYAKWATETVTAPDANISAYGVTANQMYAITRGQMTSLMADISTSTFLNNIVLLTETPIESLISLRMYPFNISAHSATGVLSNQTIYLGVYNTVVTDAVSIFQGYDNVFDLGSVTVPRYFNNFLDFAPYTKIEIWLPFIGFVNLDTTLIMGKTLSIKYVVDFNTGKCTAYIMADGVIIFTHDGVIGIDIPLGARNGAEIGRTLLKTGIETTAGAMSVIGSAVSTGATAAGKTVAGVTGTISGAASWAASTGVAAIGATQSHVIHKGSTGTASNALYAPTHCYLIITRPVVNVPNDYNKIVGRPSAMSAVLGSLTGYTEVDDVHLENITTATLDELNEIKSLLKTGVIL